MLLKNNPGCSMVSCLKSFVTNLCCQRTCIFQSSAHHSRLTPDKWIHPTTTHYESFRAEKQRWSKDDSRQFNKIPHFQSWVFLAPGSTTCRKTLDLLKSSTEPPVVDGPPDLPAAVVDGQGRVKNQRLQLQGFALEKITRWDSRQ